MAEAARVGDECHADCSNHKNTVHTHGTITSGSGNVTIEGKSAARVGDSVAFQCGHTGTIVTGSSKCTINGKKAARVGDRISGGGLSGTIINGSSKVDIA